MEATAQRPRTRSQSPEHIVDLRGLPNPESILELAAAAQSWEDGLTVRILSDDACFPNDFVRWIGGTNLKILSLRYPTADQTEVVVCKPTRLAHRVRD